MYLSILPTYLCYLILVTTLYPILYNILNLFYPPFMNITPKHKKWYVVSNLLKSIFLCILTPPALYILWTIYFDNEWNVYVVKYMATIYAVLDTVSLYMVPKMQKNTIIHHWTVIGLYSICTYYDFKVDSISNLICVYAIWSTMAFLVNFYLAYRVVRPTKTILLTICNIAFKIYLSCCLFNWSYQIYHIYKTFMYKGFLIPYVLYSFLLVNVIYDDCVLMNYLYNNSSLKKINMNFKFIKKLS